VENEAVDWVAARGAGGAWLISTLPPRRHFCTSVRWQELQNPARRYAACAYDRLPEERTATHEPKTLRVDSESVCALTRIPTRRDDRSCQ